MLALTVVVRGEEMAGMEFWDSQIESFGTASALFKLKEAELKGLKPPLPSVLWDSIVTGSYFIKVGREKMEAGAHGRAAW